MKVNIESLIERVKDLKQRVYDTNLGFQDHDHLDEDDFTLTIVIAVLETINEQENNKEQTNAKHNSDHR